MKKVNSNEINKYIADKFGANSKVMGKLDSGKIVIKTASGVTTTVSESQVSSHVLSQPNRDKQQHNSDMVAKAKELNRQDIQIEQMKKQDAIDEISAQVQRQRERRDIEHSSFSDYRV